MAELGGDEPKVDTEKSSNMKSGLKNNSSVESLGAHKCETLARVTSHPMILCQGAFCLLFITPYFPNISTIRKNRMVQFPYNKTMSIASDFKLNKELNLLSQADGVYGTNLASQLEDFLQDTEGKVADFAADLENLMIRTAPVWTGNLRESIDINEDEYPLKTFIGTDVPKMTAHAGMKVKDFGPDISGLNREPHPDWEMKGYDYTERVSSIGGTDEEDEKAHRTTANERRGGEFLNSTWLENAKVMSNQKFGSSKGVRLVKD